MLVSLVQTILHIAGSIGNSPSMLLLPEAARNSPSMLLLPGAGTAQACCYCLGQEQPKHAVIAWGRNSPSMLLLPGAGTAQACCYCLGQEQPKHCLGQGSMSDSPSMLLLPGAGSPSITWGEHWEQAAQALPGAGGHE